MGEQDKHIESSDWAQAKNLIDSLEATTAGRLMADEPLPDVNALHEQEMRRADHAGDQISGLGFHPLSPNGTILGRLQESGEVRFTLKPYLIDGRPSEGGWVCPSLEGSEVEQEREARKIRSFLDNHRDLISLLGHSPQDLPMAKEMEDKGELPVGWAERFNATYLQADIDSAIQNGHPDRATSRKQSLDMLQTEGIEPLSEPEIVGLIDTTIKTDSLQGLFD